METRPQKSASLLLAAACFAAGCPAFTSDFGEFGGDSVRSVRDRAAQRDAMLELRLDAVLADAMQASGVDCWLTVTRGESDPLVEQLVFSGSHVEGRAVLLHCGGARRYALGRGLSANETLYEVEDAAGDEQLARLLVERLDVAAPQTIAINRGGPLAVADGLSATDYEWLVDVLGSEMSSKFVSSAPLVERFLATQLDVERPLFTESARLSVAILSEVLSDRVVFAAGTSVQDLVWAVRDRTTALGLDLAFEPRVVVYRPGDTLDEERRMGLDLLLQPGDLFFLSAGVRYLGYANRYGRWAYLMHNDERVAPPWIDDTMSQLADTLERLAGHLSPGLAASDLPAAAADNVRFSVARVGRLQEGPLDPLAAGSILPAWDPGFRLAEGMGVVVSVAADRTEAGVPMTLILMESALVAARGVEFIVAPQRTPILID